MKMNHREALKILGLSASATFEDIKLAYRKASSKYHPDRNPAGLDMMKLVNSAYQSLSDYEPGMVREESAESVDIAEELNEALNAVVGLGLTIEICGSWIWVSGDTKPHREILKASGYKWAPKKLMWSFCGVERTSSRGKFSMDDIRMRHGSVNVKSQSRAQISAR